MAFFAPAYGFNLSKQFIILILYIIFHVLLIEVVKTLPYTYKFGIKISSLLYYCQYNCIILIKFLSLFRAQ